MATHVKKTAIQPIIIIICFWDSRDYFHITAIDTESLAEFKRDFDALPSAVVASMFKYTLYLLPVVIWMKRQKKYGRTNYVL